MGGRGFDAVSTTTKLVSYWSLYYCRWPVLWGFQSESAIGRSAKFSAPGVAGSDSATFLGRTSDKAGNGTTSAAGLSSVSALDIAPTSSLGHTSGSASAIAGSSITTSTGRTSGMPPASQDAAPPAPLAEPAASPAAAPAAPRLPAEDAMSKRTHGKSKKHCVAWIIQGACGRYFRSADPRGNPPLPARNSG